MNQSNQYRIELDVLAAAVENAKRERAERERNKQVDDFEGWDEVTEDVPVFDYASRITELREGPMWDARDAGVEPPRYVLMQRFPESKDPEAQKAVVRPCATVAEAVQILADKYGLECCEEDVDGLANGRTMSCDGFSLTLYATDADV